MGLLVSDAFTRAADASLQSHVPTIAGTGYTEEYDTAGTNILVEAATDAIRAVVAPTNVGVACSAQPNPALKDVDVQIKCHTAGAGSDCYVWVFARWDTTGQNYYAAGFAPSGSTFGRWVIYKCVAGTITRLVFDSAVAAVNANDVMLFEVRDGAKTLYKNGTPVISTADNAVTAAGKAGLGMGRLPYSTLAAHIHSAWKYDDFSVIEQASAVHRGRRRGGAYAM